MDSVRNHYSRNTSSLWISEYFYNYKQYLLIFKPKLGKTLKDFMDTGSQLIADCVKNVLHGGYDPRNIVIVSFIVGLVANRCLPYLGVYFREALLTFFSCKAHS